MDNCVVDTNSSNDQIAKTVQEAVPGTYKRFRGAGTGVDVDIKQHIKNLGQISNRVQYAHACGCYLEVIDLRLQTIDFWLRVYFVNKAQSGQVREREFGRLLKQCCRLGLQDSLHQKLKDFNNKRIGACHGFVVGCTDYDELQAVVEDSKRLTYEVMLFVFDNCGEVIEKFDGQHDVGDMILNVEAARLMIATGSTGGLG